MSKFVNDMSLQKQLICTQDVVDAINFGQEKANQNSMITLKIFLVIILIFYFYFQNIKKGKKPIKTIAVSLNEIERKLLAEMAPIKPVVILNVESFYNYRTLRNL